MKTPEETIEAAITINGVALMDAQSMTIRVALESFAMDLTENGLGTDHHGKEMTRLYLARIAEIRQSLYATQTQKGQPPG